MRVEDTVRFQIVKVQIAAQKKGNSKNCLIIGHIWHQSEVTTSASTKKTIDTPSNITAPLRSTAAGTSAGVSSKSAQKSGVSSIGRGRLTVVACPSEILRSSEVLSLLKHDHQCDVVMVRWEKIQYDNL